VTFDPVAVQSRRGLFYVLSKNRIGLFCPQLNWKQYFNNILNVTSYQVNESEPIIVKEPEFLRQVSQIVLQMMSTTDGRR